MSLPRRFVGALLFPARTFALLSEGPVWVDALLVVLAAGALYGSLVFPFVRQDRLRTFEASAAGFVEKYGETQYAEAEARIEGESRALGAFVVRPLLSLTSLLFTSLAALAADKANKVVGYGEIGPMTPALRKLVHGRAESEALRERAIGEGMRTLRQDAIEKVLMGLTTLEQARGLAV